MTVDFPSPNPGLSHPCSTSHSHTGLGPHLHREMSARTCLCTSWLCSGTSSPFLGPFFRAHSISTASEPTEFPPQDCKALCRPTQCPIASSSGVEAPLLLSGCSGCAELLPAAPLLPQPPRLGPTCSLFELLILRPH